MEGMTLKLKYHNKEERILQVDAIHYHTEDKILTIYKGTGISFVYDYEIEYFRLT